MMPPHEVKIRRATLDDIPILIELANVAIDEERWLTREPGQYQDAELYRPAIHHADKAVFVATIQDDVVAHILLSSKEPDGPVHFGIVVRQDLRHQGIGGLLLDRGIKWAREQRLGELHLSVYSHNAPAIALYRRKGFRQIDYRPAHSLRKNGEVWDLVTMVRDLSDVEF